MPTYDYRCNNCGHTEEIYQSFKDAELTQCPSCGTNNYERLIGCPFFFVRGEPKTLEHQAEINGKRLGREECQERELKAKERVAKARGKQIPAEPKTPWWRDGSHTNLIKSDKPLTKEQVGKYVEEMKGMGSTFNTDALPEKRKKKNGKKVK